MSIDKEATRRRTFAIISHTDAGLTLEDFLVKCSQVIPAARFGDTSEFGALCVDVCSTQAAFVTGQNFLIDGGTYPGTY
jgi:3-oxoacyl-[acyl-carrier protein] reductase